MCTLTMFALIDVRDCWLFAIYVCVAASPDELERRVLYDVEFSGFSEMANILIENCFLRVHRTRVNLNEKFRVFFVDTEIARRMKCNLCVCVDCGVEWTGALDAVPLAFRA